MQKTYTIKSREYILTIKDLPPKEKPREKLIQHGPTILSTKELLSVILSTGTKKEGVLEMSERLIKDYGEKSLLSEENVRELSRDLQIPIVKACQIVAVGELGRRFYDRSDTGFAVIRSAKDAYKYLLEMGRLPKEHLRGLYLNSHNRVIRDEIISMGTINESIIHPRDVFRPAIECNAVAIVLAHNHPSGEAMPSDEDIKVTEQLVKVGKILGIALLDHLVITKNKFNSINTKY